MRAHASGPARPGAENAKLVLHYTFDNGRATDSSKGRNNGAIDGTRAEEGRFGKALRFGAAPDADAAGEGGGTWIRKVPILVRAMALAGDVLFIAGPEDVMDESKVVRDLGQSRALVEKQDAALRGERGGVLLAISAASGETLAEMKLDSPPAWDGMIAAGGRLYVATVDGAVVCLAGR
jgi:hypothetical protein